MSGKNLWKNSGVMLGDGNILRSNNFYYIERCFEYKTLKLWSFRLESRLDKRVNEIQNLKFFQENINTFKFII